MLYKVTFKKKNGDMKDAIYNFADAESVKRIINVAKSIGWQIITVQKV